MGVLLVGGSRVRWPDGSEAALLAVFAMAGGEMTLGVAATALVCFWRSAAREFVARVVHVDPESFPLFLNLAATLMTRYLAVVVAAAFTMALTALAFVVGLLQARPDP